MRSRQRIVVLVGLMALCAPALSRVAAAGNDPQDIVGGKEARPHSFPWIVSLQEGGRHFCGGSLLSADIVITAAHCAEAIKNTPNKLEIVAGAHDLHKAAASQSKHLARSIVIHPGYSRATTKNDLALIKLATPIKLDLENPTVAPICLAAPDEVIPENTMAQVAGWGILKEGAVDLPSQLRQVPIPILSDKNMSAAYPKEFDAKVMLGAGYAKGGKDACQGDSGGPLMWKRKDTEDVWTLIGITSFGDGCARAGKPGVYTRVSAFIGWITSEVRSLSASPKLPAACGRSLVKGH